MFSSLVDKVILSPNHSGKRNHVIDTITIHTMAYNGTIEGCGALFEKKETRASSNYGIGSDGRIGGYVDEDNRSWCSSSGSNDNRAVTIEVASIGITEPFEITSKAYESLIALLVDICKRNNITSLKWKANKSLIGQIELQNMTVHRWFANKSCPGTYLYNNMGRIAEDVNKRLGRYYYIEDVPSGYYRENVERWVKQGIIKGKGTEEGKVVVDLTEDMIRTLLFAERVVSSGKH